MAALTSSCRFARPNLPLPTRMRWVGANPAWQLALEHDAKRLFPGQISSELDRRFDHPGYPWRLTYRHAGLTVDGRVMPIPVEVQFHEVPDYETYGLPPIDYPRVFADPEAKSKHRMGDDALCLWYPLDPPWRRWRHTDGLGNLLQLTADHLFLEAWWRADGADERDSEWLGDEAPHGFASDRAHRRRPSSWGRSAGRRAV